jgi:ABC-type siderophore export system fused ATPase/permease subunit
MGKTIRLHDLQYRYPGLAEFGLGPINMEIPAGKLSFWAGPNGSGKSTLASILCGELNGFSGK